MDVGGLMAEAFKTFLGNPDVMASLITWAIFSSPGANGHRGF